MSFLSWRAKTNISKTIVSSSDGSNATESELNINKITQSLDFFGQQIESGEVINENILLNHKKELQSLKRSFEKQIKDTEEYLESILLANNYCQTTKTILKNKRPRLEPPQYYEDSVTPSSISSTASTASTSSNISSASVRHATPSHSCSCSRGCSTGHCSCKKNGMKCSSFCSCDDCKN